MLIKVCRSLSVKNCHAKREEANSEDLFAVAVMTGELIVGMKNFRSLLDCSTANFLMIYWICGSNTLCSASSACRQKFLQKIFFASWHLIAKIAKISAL